MQGSAIDMVLAPIVVRLQVPHLNKNVLIQSKRKVKEEEHVQSYNHLPRNGEFSEDGCSVKSAPSLHIGIPISCSVEWEFVI